jgi:hypothetical protein
MARFVVTAPASTTPCTNLCIAPMWVKVNCSADSAEMGEKTVGQENGTFTFTLRLFVM